jgi:hypothetical protein
MKHLLWHGTVIDALDRMSDMLLDQQLIRGLIRRQTSGSESRPSALGVLESLTWLVVGFWESERLSD